MTQWLDRFIAESNCIEGIGKTLDRERDAHAAFLALPALNMEDIVSFVGIVAPGHRLRDRNGLNVRVGEYVAPRGGPAIKARLHTILLSANTGAHPFGIHADYERLHPFTDGNGRSGRAIWLWQMLRTNRAEQARQLGFLHTWYYQSLEDQRMPPMPEPPLTSPVETQAGQGGE
jgi:hypothetical protein